ncbi:MAG: hypothetical protein IPL46_02225 [Saprospiraceae bacterium]|nr:hypothetical protein [Saprospiraceae bacterium]
MKNTIGSNENPGALQISILLLLGFLILDYLSSENMKTEMSNLPTDDAYMSKVKSRCNLTEFIAINLLRSLPNHSLFKENKINEGQMLGFHTLPEENLLKEKIDYQSPVAKEVNDTRVSSEASNVYFY